MFTINLVISATPEFLSVLRALVNPKEQTTDVAPEPVAQINGTPVQKRVKKVEVAAPVTETVATGAEDTSSDSGSAEEEISFEQVRAMVQAKNQAGKKDQIKAILADFGVTRVTELQKEQYNSFHAKIASL